MQLPHCDSDWRENMSEKVIKLPDSDTSVRRDRSELEAEVQDVAGSLDGRQTSTKSGKHSDIIKEASSRPGRGIGAGAKPVPGAFGDSDKPSDRVPKAKIKSRRGGNASS
jgi:hypothetical protein